MERLEPAAKRPRRPVAVAVALPTRPGRPLRAPAPREKGAADTAPASALRWAHATNSRALLQAALASALPVDAIECDLRFGRLRGASSVLPPTELVLAHGAGEAADLSLAELLAALDARHAQGQRTPALKLDFKEPAAVLPALKLLLKRAGWPDWAPLWLNADVFQGPGVWAERVNRPAGQFEKPRPLCPASSTRRRAVGL